MSDLEAAFAALFIGLFCGAVIGAVHMQPETYPNQVVCEYSEGKCMQTWINEDSVEYNGESK